MWEKRRFLIYLENYVYTIPVSEAEHRRQVLNDGVGSEEFVSYLSLLSPFKIPFSWRLQKWFPLIFKGHYETLKDDAFKRRIEVSKIHNDCLQEKYIEFTRAGNHIKVTSSGRKLTKFWFCLNQWLKEYGELRAIILTAVGSPLLVALILFVYHHLKK